MIRLILILTLLLPVEAYSQPVKKDTDKEVLWVDGYEIAMTELFPKKRIVLADTLLCMGEYDYTVVAGFIEDSATELDLKVSQAKSERDGICDESKKRIRSARDAIESKLRLDLKLSTERFNFTKTALDSLKTAHHSDLKHHYIVEAVLSTALLGVISALLIK